MIRVSKDTVELSKDIRLKITINSAVKVNIMIIRFVRRIRLSIR